MKPILNLEREIGFFKDIPEGFTRLLVRMFNDVYSRLGTSVSAVGTITSVASSSGSGTSSAVVILTNSVTVTDGSNTITLPGAGLSSSDYIVFAWVAMADGLVTPLGDANSKTTTTFTYNNLPAGTLYYSAQLRS